MGDARPLKLDDVRGFEYVEVDQKWLSRLRANWDDWWGDQTPIATCVRCGRYTEDVNRDAVGEPMHQDPEDDHENVCSECIEKALTESLKAIIDEQVDFSDEDRAALKKVVELVVHEPDKVLELKDLGNKVRSLEKQNNFLWLVVVGVIVVLFALLIAPTLA